jgi:hypothetical protein
MEIEQAGDCACSAEFNDAAKLALSPLASSAWISISNQYPCLVLLTTELPTTATDAQRLTRDREVAALNEALGCMVAADFLSSPAGIRAFSQVTSEKEGEVEKRKQVVSISSENILNDYVSKFQARAWGALARIACVQTAALENRTTDGEGFYALSGRRGVTPCPSLYPNVRIERMNTRNKRLF